MRQKFQLTKLLNYLRGQLLCTAFSPRHTKKNSLEDRQLFICFLLPSMALLVLTTNNSYIISVILRYGTVTPNYLNNNNNNNDDDDADADADDVFSCLSRR